MKLRLFLPITAGLLGPICMAFGMDMPKSTHLGQRLNASLYNLRHMKEHLPKYLPQLKAMIQNGADTNVDSAGMPSLFAAIELGNEDLIKLLLENGANANQKLYGQSPLFYLLQLSLIGLVDYTNSTMHSSRIPRPNINIIQLLIEYGTDVKATDNYGRSALMLAAKAGEVEIVQLLAKDIPLAQLNRLRAVKSSYFNLLPVEILINVMKFDLANPNLQDTREKYSINYAIQQLEEILDKPHLYNDVDPLIRRYEEVINILAPLTKT